MEKAVKSSPEYIMDENHFKDFEYEFDYCIIHDKNDIGYFSGTLTSALAEFMVFKDNESFMHFLAVLIQSKILIPVGICPPGQNTQNIIKIPDCKNDCFLYMKNANVVPIIKFGDKTRFFSAFGSIREIHSIAHNHMFLYIGFETAYKWIKKHRKEIDVIALDNFSKHEYSWYIETDDFIKQIDKFKKFAKNYSGKNLVADLYNISLQKHMPK